MAIVNSQLIISPVIRQYFIDPNTQLPVVGYVNFFKIDKITPKNTYQQDGVGGFQVAANPVVLDSAGAIPYVIYLYPYDETDETVEELYYVEVRRTTDDSLVFALDNFPQNFVFNDGGGSTGEDVINKCPSYGFDNPIFGETYTKDSENQLKVDWSPILQNGAFVAQGWLWQLEDLSNSEFYYQFTALASGSRPGNPINLLTLLTGNIQTQSQNVIGFRLGVSNELEGTEINYQLDLQDNLSVLSTLDVLVFKGSTLDDISTAINVGTIPISSSLTLQTINFVMPDVSGIISDNDNDPVWLLLSLPLTSQFSISLTSTYNYFGDASTIARLPLSYGVSESRQLISTNNVDLYGNSGDNLLNSSGLPLTYRKGELDALLKTGQIFLASNSYNADLNEAQALSDQTLVKGDNLLSTLSDRFLDEAQLSQYGGNTFEISNASGTSFDINTQVLANSYRDWVSSEPTEISITKNEIGSTLFTSTVLNNVVSVTFNTNYDAQCINNYDIKEQIHTTPQRGTVYSSNVMHNNVGVYSGTGGTSTSQVVDFAVGPEIVIAQVASGSAGFPAECTITFTAGGFSAVDDLRSGDTTIQDDSENDRHLIVFKNFLSATDAPIGDIGNPPPYVIQFDVDGEGENVSDSQKRIVVNFDSAQITDQDYLANTLNNALNSGPSYTIDVLSMPTSGITPTNLYISTSNKDMYIVMFDTGTQSSPPPKPDTSISTIFVEYDSTTFTLDQVREAIQEAIIANSGSIPSHQDLLLEAPTTNLAYYVFI